MGERGERKRRIRNIAASLAAGMLLSIVIAIAAAVWSPVETVVVADRDPNPQAPGWKDVETSHWDRWLGGSPLGEQFDELESLLGRERLDVLGVKTGMAIRANTREGAMKSNGWAIDIEAFYLSTSTEFFQNSARVTRFHVGWPWRCLHAHYASAYYGPQGQARVYAEWWHGWPLPAWHIPKGRAYLQSGAMHSTSVIPYGIWWGGLIANTVLFAGCLWGLPAAVRFVRRERRLERGQCCRCSYDRAGLAPASPCPECGEVGSPHRAWWRQPLARTLRVSGYGAAGMAASIAIAWACTMREQLSFIEQGGRSWDEKASSWKAAKQPGAVTPALDARELTASIDAIERSAWLEPTHHWRTEVDKYGLRLSQSLHTATGLGVDVQALQIKISELTSNIITVTRAGWPVRCVTASHWNESGSMGNWQHWKQALEPPAVIAPASQLAGVTGTGMLGVLPYRLVFPGMIVNAALYGTLLYALVSCGKWARRRRTWTSVARSSSPKGQG